MILRSALLASTATLALGSVVVLAAPGTAAPCTTIAHTSTAGILTTTDGETGGPPSAATATLRTTGVQVALPDSTSKAQWLLAAPSGTLLSDVRDARIRMRQDVPGSVVLPSYQLVIDPDPADTTAGAPHFSTLVWEPYKNGYGYESGFRSYDVDEPAALWWSTRTLPLVPGAVQGAQAPFTLATYKAAYPRARVLAYGWNAGKGSAGVKATIAAWKFETGAVCTSHTWAKPVVTQPPSATPSLTPSATGTPSATASATSSATATATGTPSATASATSSVSASPSATRSPSPGIAGFATPEQDDGLPVTGASLSFVIAGAAGLLVAGGALLWWTRRRTR